MEGKETAEKGEIALVLIEEVLQNPFQPRKHFSEEEIKELAVSIQEIGLIHPPVVRKRADGFYELIAGERRLRALKSLGRKQIFVLVKEATNVSSEESALVENLQRVDLNPLEVAVALRNLMKATLLTQERLADKIGKKRSTVANYLRLLELPNEIKGSLSEGKISMGHAKALHPLPKAFQISLCDEILNEGLSVRETERRALLKKEGKETKARAEDPFLRDIRLKLEASFGTKIRVTKNQIVIDYYSLDDLDRLLEVMKC